MGAECLSALTANAFVLITVKNVIDVLKSN